MHGNKEKWSDGETAYFEYHCLEAPDSADAEAWYRSHQVVTVLGRALDEDFGGTFDERAEACLPNLYRVRFPDGLEWDVFEDELATGPEFFYRPDPPQRPST